MLSADIFNNTLCSSVHQCIIILPLLPSTCSSPLLHQCLCIHLLQAKREHYCSCSIFPAVTWCLLGSFTLLPHSVITSSMNQSTLVWSNDRTSTKRELTQANTGRHRHNLFYSKTFDHAQVFWLAATCKSMGWFINTYIKVMFCNLSEKITITNTEICYKTD